MIVCQGVNVTKSFGENILFKNVCFEIGEQDRIGFVGVNGSGKTTLFKIIMEQIPCDNGEIYFSKFSQAGYMEQHINTDSGRTLYEEMESTFSSVVEVEHQLEEIARRIDCGTKEIHSLIHEQQILQEKFESMGGLTYKSRTRSALLGLGFRKEEFNLPCSKLSGGQKSKISLGKLLLSPCNLLLLDEPTNHLDIASVEWLEEFLKNYSGAAIIISHDRYFLDKVTNRTFELEHRRLTAYHGNYTAYLKKKSEDKEILQHHYQNAMKEIHRIENIIVQQRQWNREKNIRTAESKQKMLDRLKEDLVKPENELEQLHFQFTSKAKSGNEVLSCKSLAKSFDQKELFHDVNFQIRKGDRVCLLGANGCGKTTLLRMIVHQLSPDTGAIEYGTNVDIGYFDQAQANLHMDKLLINEIWDEYPDMTQTEIRSALAAFLFKSEDVFKRMRDLSGGERARTALLKLMLSGANFLLLDEPTNHLDITSREALEKALLEYDGTLLMVSHDRYFINKLATRVLDMSNEGIVNYDGNYDYFLQKKILQPQTIEIKKPVVQKANEYKERKAKESEHRRLLGKIARLEKKIEQTEEEITNCEVLLENPEVASDYEKLLQVSAQHKGLQEQLNEFYSEWEELQTAAEIQ